MQIALTKKMADAMGVKPLPTDENLNPLFTWTANWTKVWDNRQANDMLVLVNNATRFTVAIYQVKRNNLKNAAKMMEAAISNTLLFMNFNPELVQEYMRLAGEVQLTRNRSRHTATWVTKSGMACAFHVDDEYNGIAKMFCDTVGASTNYRYVNYSANSHEGFLPYEAMIDKLFELTGKRAFKYDAFELLITLDLEVYKATRRIIVPADIEFTQLHKVLQYVFDWDDSHLHDFTILSDNNRTAIARIVPFEEDLEYDESAILAEGHVLSEFLPEHKHMLYTYDMGDEWEHEILLTRVIEEHDEESPYLLQAIGQTPPEDVGGVAGFVDFRKIMLDPNHPEYEETKKWAKYWSSELADWKSRPQALHL